MEHDSTLWAMQIDTVLRGREYTKLVVPSRGSAIHTHSVSSTLSSA